MNGWASRIVPFPYAGMTQFRFQGLISARLSPDTPNGDDRTVRPPSASVKNRGGRHAADTRRWADILLQSQGLDGSVERAGLTGGRALGYIPIPFDSGREDKGTATEASIGVSVPVPLSPRNGGVAKW